ncbi:PREDICTED: relaxin-3-like [Nanorana parkeri]|uniref:relaxin-3-like n=1 Tax=Nanorana parkeri TaxID=125878 RepID=UPI00085466FA|nr:PREDICTED: relaxin-3-like [Nanorana parkeri]
MALLRGTMLFAAGLLMLVSALPGELRGQRSPVTVSEYGVKLCGREFIRAVIFTCGGSRWKRLDVELPEDEQRESGFLRRDNLQDSTNREINQLMIQTLLGTNLEQLQKPDFHLQQQQQLLKDPFIAYDDFKDRIPASEGFSEYMHQVEDTDRKIQRESQSSGTRGSNLFPWTAFSRTRREMSIGVAGICCKWGCTKSEISTLC